MSVQKCMQDHRGSPIRPKVSSTTICTSHDPGDAAHVGFRPLLSELGYGVPLRACLWDATAKVDSTGAETRSLT